jgi:hypothetical protein
MKSVTMVTKEILWGKLAKEKCELLSQSILVLKVHKQAFLKAESSGLYYKHITIKIMTLALSISLELHLLMMLESSFMIGICL